MSYLGLLTFLIGNYIYIAYQGDGSAQLDGQNPREIISGRMMCFMVALAFLVMFFFLSLLTLCYVQATNIVYK